MPPPSWKPCPHCGQKFGSGSLKVHVKRCNERAEVKAEHELRELEGFSKPPPLPDWPQCPNCGDQYGPTAIGPHTKRCKRLCPNGLNGYGSGGNEPPPKTLGASQFAGLWGLGDLEPLIRELATKSGINEKAEAGVHEKDKVRSVFEEWDKDGNGSISEDELKQVISGLMPHLPPEAVQALFNAADVNKDGVIDYDEFLNFLYKPPKVEVDLDALRAVFNRFDTDKDGNLSPEEFNCLLQNMLPTRSGDFQIADRDGSGMIDFDEFVEYWKGLGDAPNLSLFDEAADMFECFDRDGSGELNGGEFLALLNNAFPEHCEENEQIVRAEFAQADIDGGDGIAFNEFLAYYDRLTMLYKSGKGGWPPSDAAAREASLDQDFQRSPCGLSFLPDRLQVHMRGCAECKEANRRAEEERRRLREEEEARRRAEEEARRKRLQDEEDARRKALQDAADDEEARRRALQEAEDARRRQWEEEEAEELRRRAEEEANRRRGPQPDENGFIPCEFCGRKFFPDRLPVHLRVCKERKKKQGGQLCRETVTPGEDVNRPTRGQYDLSR